MHCITEEWVQKNECRSQWVSGLHISHTFMKNYGTNKHPAKNFSNADFISVNWSLGSGLTF